MTSFGNINLSFLVGIGRFATSATTSIKSGKIEIAFERISILKEDNKPSSSEVKTRIDW